MLRRRRKKTPTAFTAKLAGIAFSVFDIWADHNFG
jgi:hypothetical protein